jgi:hypothetical protein
MPRSRLGHRRAFLLVGFSGFRVAHREGVEDAAVLYPLVHELVCGEEGFGNFTAEARGGRRVKFFVKEILRTLCALRTLW